MENNRADILLCFLIENCNLPIVQATGETSTLQREHPAHKLKFINFFIFLFRIGAPLDPDPDPNADPDPDSKSVSGYTDLIESGSKHLIESGSEHWVK
jgi:hypothetical protein